MQGVAGDDSGAGSRFDTKLQVSSLSHRKYRTEGNYYCVGDSSCTGNIEVQDSERKYR